jgi:hypothetical protein
MTPGEMNASPAKKSWIAAVAALPALCACAGAFNPATDASSPAAARVDALAGAKRDYPRWADFPTASTDAPTPQAVAARVATLHVGGAALADEASQIDWTLADAPGFAAETLARATPPPPPDGDKSPAELEAFAQALRARAVPPPPVDRH